MEGEWIMKNEDTIKEYLKQELSCHHVQVYLQEHEGMLPDYVPEKLSELCGEEVVEVECTLLDDNVYLLGVAYTDICTQLVVEMV